MTDGALGPSGNLPHSHGGREARHIFLIGFMGSGKSTVGRLVASELRRDLVDLDTLIEERSGRSIADVFAAEGEPGFRALERDALSALRGHAPAVVACGGGVVLLPENRRLLKSLGCTVHLVVTAGEALARIGDVEGRPLLATSNPGAVAALLSAREGLYRAAADATVDTGGKTAREVASETVEALRAAGCAS